MKNFLVIVIFALTTLTLNAQEDRTNFRAGINAGLVQGDFSDFYSFNLGLDLVYVWGVSKTLDLGFATGFSNAFGEEDTLDGGLNGTTSFDNVQFLPVAGALRVYPAYGFKFGGDLGYAVGTNEGNEGGLYYKPVVGVDVNGNTEINVAYAVVSNDAAFSTIQVGVLFLF